MSSANARLRLGDIDVQIVPTSQIAISTVLAFALVLGLSGSLSASVADTVTPTLPNNVYPEVRTILSTGSTIIGEPILYPPAGAPALISAVEITLQPKQQTGWHTYPVPLFGYILEGGLTVDYGPEGQRIYRKGDALVEAMNEAHNGRNTGEIPVRILAVFIGMEGVQGTVPASPPGR
jgi:quercetin dioxygenase-like cupin family protein